MKSPPGEDDDGKGGLDIGGDEEDSLISSFLPRLRSLFSFLTYVSFRAPPWVFAGILRVARTAGCQEHNPQGEPFRRRLSVWEEGRAPEMVT